MAHTTSLKILVAALACAFLVPVAASADESL